MTCAPVATISICPSGGDRMTYSAPTTPLAPARFSTTTGWPIASRMPSATARAKMSVPPPGA